MKLAPTAGGGAIKSIDAAIIDPIPEPSAGLPPVTPTLLQKMQYFWATWRNDATETATEQKIRNDAGTELAKRPAQNDDGVTFTNSKWEAP